MLFRVFMLIVMNATIKRRNSNANYLLINTSQLVLPSHKPFYYIYVTKCFVVAREFVSAFCGSGAENSCLTANANFMYFVLWMKTTTDFSNNCIYLRTTTNKCVISTNKYCRKLERYRRVTFT